MSQTSLSVSINDFQKRFQENIQQEFKQLKKPNILIIGRAGVGKSSLINATFGSDVARVGAGKPVTLSYKCYSSPDVLVNIYDSAGWEGGAEGEQKFLKDTEDFLNQRQTANLEDRIHIVWYLVDAPGARFTDFDARIVRNSLKDIPVLFILSKSDIADENQIDSLKNVIDESNIPNQVGIIEVAASPMMKRGKLICEPYGLDEVVSKTLEILPDLLRRAFIAAQQVNLSEKDKETRDIIIAATTAAFWVGFSPIPFSDTPVLLAGQVGLVARIAVIYGFKPVQVVTSFVGGIVGGVSTAVIGLLLADFLKFIPGVGTSLGSLVDGTIGAILTAALGFSFRELFREIVKSNIKGEQVQYTEEWMQSFLQKRFQQEWDRLLKNKKLAKKLDDYEPLDE
ncbi:MAG TPA: hypothetical protein DDW76_06045 [Cyanobacteria bacterium UBA11369]|nr:hypothetical protein [Cyanobacteria bacterium UBA11371]HBE18260.1 hypothetical protein [Cyanobacteria bacterium UBA11367]HBE31988.1 hypothetical protein [Cyanobacteria bacterium UBA11368]HBE48367.1 hypothetical protein [Cyanobacteria bacterium UBA11369]